MSLSIKGKLSTKLSVESGTSKAGKEWKKQSFVLNTGAQYRPEICFQMFGEEKMEILNKFSEGDEIEVFFNLSSQEYNGRYFHNIDAWRIEKIQADLTENVFIEEEASQEDAPPSQDDDLPF
ncbi:MAG: DUF3127 domain-containing protein [Bacteroidota bacterium]|nr:DUF3127 domain-containing protein [Bacteroidota bacterium]